MKIHILCRLISLSTLWLALCFPLDFSIASAQQNSTPASHVSFNQARTIPQAGDSAQAALLEGEHLQGKEQIDFWMSLQEHYASVKNYQARQIVLERMITEPSKIIVSPPAKSIDLLGQNWLLLNNPDKAEACFQEAIRMLEGNSGSYTKTLLPTLGHLAEFYKTQNKTEQATTLEKRIEDIKAHWALCPDEKNAWPEYVAMMQKKIRSQWTPPKSKLNHRIVVYFRVLNDGSIDRSQIVISSGSAQIDESALKAVNIASPLPPLPVPCYGAIAVQFIFDYQLTNSQQAKASTPTQKKSFLRKLFEI